MFTELHRPALGALSVGRGYNWTFQLMCDAIKKTRVACRHQSQEN